MERFRTALAVALDRTGFAVNVVVLCLCWWATARFYSAGRVSLAAAPPLPTGFDEAWGLATSPALGAAIVNWAAGVVSIAIALGFGLSSVHGTWWLLRRLTRPL